MAQSRPNWALYSNSSNLTAILLDHVVTMNEQYLTGLCRRSRHAFEGRHREFRKRAKKGVEMLLQAMEIVLDSRPADGNVQGLGRLWRTCTSVSTSS